MAGGVEKHIHELSKELVKQGDHVTVVTHKLSTDNISLDSTVDGVHYKYYKAPFDNYYMISGALVSTVVQTMHNYDVVHLQAIHKPLSMLLLLRLRKAPVKVAFTPHYHGSGHSGFSNFAHIFYRRVSSVLMGRVDQTIAVSDGEADLIHAHFPRVRGKISVIPNGVVEPTRQQPLAKEKPVVLSVSRLEPYKRIDTVIREIPHEMRLVVVGTGRDYDRLQLLARALRKDVLFTGHIGDDELSKWWCTADAFISLSEKEAYGLTFGEAMSMGLPCIVSDIPAHRFVYKLFEKPSGVAFYDANQDLVTQCESVITETTAKSRAATFTWDKAARQLSELYRDMV